MYPSSPQYRHSILNKFYPPDNGGYKFTAVLLDDEPQYEPGNKAIVFKVTDDYSQKTKALKLFLSENKNRFKQYIEISEYLNQLNNNYFVDFNFIEKLIYVEANSKESDNYFPGLVMDWANGFTLGTKIKDLCNSKNRKELKKLSGSFKELSIFLLDNKVGHGDLKHDNIIVDENGQMKLVDYDGMFVPAFSNQLSNELGTDSFQHPGRNNSDFNERIDHFSILTIYVSILALSANPDLYNRFNDQQNLLFTKEDFLYPDNSELFKILSNEKETKSLTFFVKQSLASNNIYIDNIKDLLNGKIPKPHLSITHKPEKVLIGELVKISWSAENASFVKVNGVEYLKVNSIEEVVKKDQKFQFEYGNGLETIKQDYKIDTVPKPEISNFSANHVALKFDEKLELKWAAKNFKSAYLKYNQIQIDVSEVNRYIIEGLTKNLIISLELISLINNRKVNESINIEVYYPVSLKVSQEKKITFPNRSVKLLIDTENAQKVTLSPLNIDLTGKKEFDLKTDKDISFVIVAENNRYNVAHRSEIEVLKAPAYTKKVIELPKIDFNVPLPQFNKFPKEYFINNHQKKDTVFISFFKIIDKLKIFKINFQNHFTK